MLKVEICLCIKISLELVLLLEVCKVFIAKEGVKFMQWQHCFSNVLFSWWWCILFFRSWLCKKVIRCNIVSFDKKMNAVNKIMI